MKAGLPPAGITGSLPGGGGAVGNQNDMARIKIKRGDPQPVDCPKCGTKQGYQVSVKMVTDFVDFYFHDGTREGGAYSDYQRVISESTSAYCMNCVTKLPFKIDANA